MPKLCSLRALALLVSAVPFALAACAVPSTDLETTGGGSEALGPTGLLWVSFPEGLRHVDLDGEYLPRVVEQEIAGVTDLPAALQAQAVAARTYLARGMQDSGYGKTKSNPVPCGTSFQACASSSSASARAAVSATRGVVMTYGGKLTNANFDSGCSLLDDGSPRPPNELGSPYASWETIRSLIRNGTSIVTATRGLNDFDYTEVYVTTNDGKTGASVAGTLQASVSATNRGAMGQIKAVWLAKYRGWNYARILRYFYGADLELGASAPPPPPPPPPGGTGALPWTWFSATDQGLRTDGAGDGAFLASRASGNPHTGVDFYMPRGTPLFSPCDGQVLTGSDPAGYGNWVELACPAPAELVGAAGTWASILYGHLDAVNVASGAVRRAQKLGVSGKTGNAAASGVGPHVHVDITIQASAAEALADLHASSEHAANAASGRFLTALAASCTTPTGFSGTQGTSLGRLVDPFILFSCLSSGKPPLTSPAGQSLVKWSTLYSSRTFDVNAGRN